MSEGGLQNAIISGKPDCPYHFDLYRVDGGQTSWFTARRGACAAGSYSRLPFSARTSRCRRKAYSAASTTPSSAARPSPQRSAPVTTGALQTNQQRTRFVIGLPKTTEFEVFSLTNPNRVVVQVTETKLRLPEQPKTAPVGLIKSFQAGLAGTDRSRVIIYVTEPVIVSSARIEKAKDGRAQHLVVEIASFVPVTASIAPPAKQKTVDDAAAVRTGRRRPAAAAAAPGRLAGRARAARLQADHRHRSRPRRA